MLTRLADDRIDVQIESRSTMDQELDSAVDELLRTALRTRAGGILVSRMTDTHFTVAISELVPFGRTDQRDCRPSTSGGSHLAVSGTAPTYV